MTGLAWSFEVDRGRHENVNDNIFHLTSNLRLKIYDNVVTGQGHDSIEIDCTTPCVPFRNISKMVKFGAGRKPCCSSS